MSEELIQKGYTEHGIKIGNYEFYDLGDTTLEQLKIYKIVPNKNYGNYKSKRPDGLLVDRQNKKQSEVIVCVEYKQPSEFRTDRQKKQAIQQCNTYTQIIDGKIGVITDGQVTFWINPKQDNEVNNYIDDATKIGRSYSFIRNEDKKDLSEPFIIQKQSETEYDKLDDDTKNTSDYIDRILSHINSQNSTLVSNQEVDPLSLARSVWQDIYINTGKDPTKCLYNVVELFIFKFLSDLGVLKDPYDFESLLNMYGRGIDDKGVLKYYAINSRAMIREKFPEGIDGTTIINGTIFVKSDGTPVPSQAHLFKNALKKYRAFGSLKNVKKEFKTKLFETFLKQSKDKSKLGQFLTPRKVVRAIVEMSDVENLPDGSRFCDPFCGVGGFLCESLHKTKRKNDFLPKNGVIKPKITYHGFDKGSDEEEERTVILAKANMLIYLSGIVEKYPTLTHEFAKAFNEIFYLLTDSNLGTLKKRIEKEEEKYDLILTNPPYITSGVTSIRDEIKTEKLSDYYTKGGQGVQGLALEWIIRALKKGGKAFIIIPYSILRITKNKDLRAFMRQECYLNCIISLPINTFFNTPQKTFILGITKKESNKQEQDFPVFTYLVSNIGETLNVDRFEIEGKSDLEKAKDWFNSYKGSPKTFPINEIDDLRCKLQSIEKFDKNPWIIDEWWSKEEKIELGIEEKVEFLTIEDLSEKLENIHNHSEEAIEQLNTGKFDFGKDFEVKEVKIMNICDRIKISKKYTKEDIDRNKGNIPVYSSQSSNQGIIGYVKEATVQDCSPQNTYLTFGDHTRTIFIRTTPFSVTDNIKVLKLKDEFRDKVNEEYIIRIWANLIPNLGYSRHWKEANNVILKIPINKGGDFDIEKQKEIAEKYIYVETLKEEIVDEMKSIIKSIKIE